MGSPDAYFEGTKHVVPPAWAWKRGAKTWSEERRERFGNDGINLWPVEASLNRSKNSRGPDKWLPPSNQCGYVGRFLRIVKQYDLQPSSAETKWMNSFPG
ncbi:GmrSD restriction endonuclease domain-containing protein [Marinobacter sp.]|uniref:GmrSD restriction endonuclease domain-containing protein n=1 Tax=Marinobacter sp. TaxID=50741 RepID=UPI003B528A42